MQREGKGGWASELCYLAPVKRQHAISQSIPTIKELCDVVHTRSKRLPSCSRMS